MFEPTDDIEWTPQHRDRTRDDLMRQVQRDTRPRKKRNPWLFVVPSVVLAAVVTGGIALLLPVTDKNTVHCLARAELHENGSYPGMSVAVGAPTGHVVPVEDAIAGCTLLWNDGLLDPADPDGQTGGNGVPPTLRPDRDGAVPELLTVCVMGNGTAAVIPGDQNICGRLGLANRLDI
jgi:hypothetical protein